MARSKMCITKTIALVATLVTVASTLPTIKSNHELNTQFLPEHWAQEGEIQDKGPAGDNPYQPDNQGPSKEFICAYRSYAYEYGQKLKPKFDKTILFDSLMLGTLCNQTRPAETPNRFNAGEKLPASGSSVYVSTSGSDSNPGTQAQPKATVEGGLAATRKMPMGPKSLLIEAGTYYPSATIELTAMDSQLSIRGQGEVWISGGRALPQKLEWKVDHITPAQPAMLSNEVGQNNQHGCMAGSSQSGCTCYGATTPQGMDEQKCHDMCQSMGPTACTSFGWSGPDPVKKNDGWANNCCIRSDGVWNPSPLAGHTSGQFSQATPEVGIYSTQLGDAWIGSNLSQLRIVDADSNELKRSPRARYPNGNPETDQWPKGWNIGAVGWLPPKPSGQPLFVTVNNSEIDRRNSTSFDYYGGGIGGPCSVFSPPFSYWCQAHPSGGGGFQYFVPSGLEYSDGNLPTNASEKLDTSEWTLHLWRRSHWANWMFDVDSIDTATNTINFGRGGYQGCRGGNGSDWYVENAKAFLDSTDEHYFDKTTATLYRAFNSTPTGNEHMAAPNLQTILSGTAAMTNPIKGVSISNIGFRDAAPTYMEPHSVPSGGDWALERRAAVFFEGVENLTVNGCTFERNDGNGLMLSGYTRDVTISDNEFSWTGGSAVVAWGITDEISDNGIHGWNGTDGNHPLNTRVVGNIMRETGIWEKQASCWFQAKTARTTLIGNMCFNLARAGFNFNDGFAGGDHVESNLIFNSCRESADHGPINSWDRQPYVTMYGLNIGTPSGLMAPRNITRNFLVANYGGGNGAVDNDDGSEFYRNNHNFAVYGHQKFKVGSIESYGNVLAYVSGFGEKWDGIGNIAAHPHAMYNNTVVFNPNGAQEYHNVSPWNAYNNKLYGPKVVLPPKRGTGDGITLPEYQKQDPSNNDVGSTWSREIPHPAMIIDLAKTILEPIA